MEKTRLMAFLKYWDRKDASFEEKTDFIVNDCMEWHACEEMGAKIYSYEFFIANDPKLAIREELEKHQPDWVLGIENTATLLLSYRNKKILINPRVTVNDLNRVTEAAIRDTYAFFSADYEKDYDIYSRVYRNSAYYILRKGLTISELRAPIMEIIEDYAVSQSSESLS